MCLVRRLNRRYICVIRRSYGWHNSRIAISSSMPNEAVDGAAPFRMSSLQREPAPPDAGSSEVETDKARCGE